MNNFMNNFREVIVFIAVVLIVFLFLGVFGYILIYDNYKTIGFCEGNYPDLEEYDMTIHAFGRVSYLNMEPGYVKCCRSEGYKNHERQTSCKIFKLT